VLHGLSEPGILIGIEPVSDQVSSRAQGFGIGGSELVVGHHFEDHAIVTLVLVEGLDDPISPVLQVSLTVLNQTESPQAVPIAVAPHIHPMSPLALPVMGAL